MKTIAIFIILNFFLLHAQEELGIEDVIEMGLKNNFDIQIARNNAEIAENNTMLGTSGFLPVLDASGGYQQSSSSVETNSPFGFGDSDRESISGQVQLNWILFDGFRMFTDKKRYNELAELGEYQTRNIIENTVVGIMRSYFNLVQQEQLLMVAENSLAISETRLNKERVRNELGGVSSTDLLNARVSYNNDQMEFLNQLLNVEIARKELNIILGRNPAETINVAKSISIAQLSLNYDEILELTMENNSRLSIARSSLRASELNKKISGSAFLPRLSFNGAYNYSDQTDETESRGEINSESLGWIGGINLTWNLFNGFRNSVEIQNRKLEVKNSTLALRDEENRLAGLVKEKYDTFRKQMQLLDFEDENVTAARQNLQLQQDRFEIGTASSLEFRDAQLNLALAQNRQISARYQARINRLEIDQLIGRILE